MGIFGINSGPISPKRENYHIGNKDEHTEIYRSNHKEIHIFQSIQNYATNKWQLPWPTKNWSLENIEQKDSLEMEKTKFIKDQINELLLTALLTTGHHKVALLT